MVDALPAVALAVSFVDRINRRDLAGLSALMSESHRLEVFDETPLVGKQANLNAWRGYFDNYPHYVIHPCRIAEKHENVAILGHTTGSHLDLTDDDESKLTLIWIATVSGGAVSRWQLIEDTDANRSEWGLDDV